MSTSTNANLSFGISIEEDAELPWDKFDDIEYWWAQINGFKPTGTDAEWREQREFLKQNPLPVELVNYCSGEYPMWILAVPGSVITANRGYPTNVFPLATPTADAHATFKAFCDEHGFTTEPQWWLSSYWG